jgi:hypothetical protein
MDPLKVTLGMYPVEVKGVTSPKQVKIIMEQVCYHARVGKENQSVQDFAKNLISHVKPSAKLSESQLKLNTS